MSDTTTAGDSSEPPQKPPSVESNFRQLDDAFLETQAIIWLGEILEIRFDQNVNISDLLANGELLCEVSEVISKMIPTLSMDDSQLKAHEWKSLASNKSTRIYMPYYNVDSFLRMCKNLGMDGIDLFTPSDVVERRNTRKVCMCLRLLSKKVKLRDLNVPDFDSVTCTLAMPTNKVEYIRKSLERSQSSSSLSAEQEVEKVSRVRLWRRMSNSASAHSSHDSDNCDEVESHLVVEEPCGSSDYPYDAESLNTLGSQVVKNEDDNKYEYFSPCNAESVGSPCSQNYSDEDLSFPSSNCQGSRVSGEILELFDDMKLGYRNGDLNHIPIDWGDSFMDVGKYKDICGNDKDEVASLSHNKEGTDTTCSNGLRPTGSDMCNGYPETLNDSSDVDYVKSLELDEPSKCTQNDDFHGDKSQKLSCDDSIVCEGGFEVRTCEKSKEIETSSEFLNQSSNVLEILENLSEKSDSFPKRLYNGNSCVELESVSGQLGFCDPCEEQDPCSMDNDAQNHTCSELLAVKSNGTYNTWDPVRIVHQSRTSIPLLLDVDTIICGDIPSNDKEGFGVNSISANHLNQHREKGLTYDNINNLLDIPCVDLNSSPDVVLAKNTMECSKDCDDDLESSNGHNYLLESFNGKPIDSDNIILVDGFATSSSDLQLEAQSPQNIEDTSQEKMVAVKEVDKGQDEVPKQEGTNKELSIPKPQRKLLKAVVKGTAVVGLAVFLVHLRNNLRENRSDAKKQSTRLLKHGTTKQLHESGSINIVYPAEKLHLGV